MWNSVKCFLIFTFAIFAITRSTNGNAQTQPGDPGKKLQPQDQTKLYVTMWHDGNDQNAYDNFFKGQVCKKLDLINGSTLDLEIKLGPQAEVKGDGLYCPVSRTDCQLSVLLFCAKKQCKTNKQMLEFYCCTMSDKSSCPVDTVNIVISSCVQAHGIDSNAFLDCLGNQQTPQDLVNVWQTEGKPLFPPDAKFAAFLINGKYYGETSAMMSTDFFSTTCQLYAKGSAPSYCP